MYIDLEKKPEDLTISEYFCLNLIYEKETNYFNTIEEQILKTLESNQYIKLISKNLNDVIIREKTNKLLSGTKKNNKEIGEEIRAIFPEGVKSGGYLVRSSAIDINEKLKKWKPKYKFSNEIILSATRLYVEDFKKVNYEFMLAAKYFIHKEGRGSALADYCDMIINKEEKQVFINKM